MNIFLEKPHKTTFTGGFLFKIVKVDNYYYFCITSKKEVKIKWFLSSVGRAMD